MQGRHEYHHMAQKKSRSVLALVKEAFSEWKEDNASRLAASLAYYTTFSISPLLVLIIAVAGLLGSRQAVHDQVMVQIEGLVGHEGMVFVENMLAGASQPRHGVLAGVLGILALLLGALGVFTELQNSLNTIWEVKPKLVQDMKQSIWHFLKQRIISFSMVLAIGFVLVASLAVSAALSALGNLRLNTSIFPVWLFQAINQLISFIVITLLFALMFKVLPDAKIAWWDVWLGAGVTSLLFNLGKFAIGFYLGRSSISSSFGAAGSLVVILVWVYYSAQIFFFGAEVTQVYANDWGSRTDNDKDAINMSERERIQQGIPHQEEIE